MSGNKCQHGSCSDWHVVCYWCAPEEEHLLDDLVILDERHQRVQLEAMTRVVPGDELDGSERAVSTIFRYKGVYTQE